MGYMSRNGKKPQEPASKTSHSNIINDQDVKDFLGQCRLPKDSEEIVLGQDSLHLLTDELNPIKHVIAIDGGNTEVPVKKSFPSSTMTFFQFGVNMFNLSDLDHIAQQPFIAPEEIEKLKQIERFKLVLPTKNVVLKGIGNLTNSIRKSLNDFFLNPRDKDGNNFGRSLRWFLFEEYSDNPKHSYTLASCPSCRTNKVDLENEKLDKYLKSKCPHCQNDIYLIDAFRLHEAIDDEVGAGGITGYVTTLIEQIILVHYIRFIRQMQPDMLGRILFLKDGPLAFFGQTANMHGPMRSLCNYLEAKHNLFLAGLTKSGSFVEHAQEIQERVTRGHYFIPDNRYIYSYIQPGDPSTTEPYAQTSYYSCNVFFRSSDGGMHVVTLPSKDEFVVMAPSPEKFKNINIVMQCVGKLKCDMYDSALLPIALVNKLVSLSNHPSAVLLQRFAVGSLGS